MKTKDKERLNKIVMKLEIEIANIDRLTKETEDLNKRIKKTNEKLEGLLK